MALVAIDYEEKKKNLEEAILRAFPQQSRMNIWGIKQLIKEEDFDKIHRILTTELPRHNIEPASIIEYLEKKKKSEELLEYAKEELAVQEKITELIEMCLYVKGLVIK